MRKLPAFSALVIAWSALCGFAGAATPPPYGNDALFPELPGYTLVHESRVYASQDLWDFIDGAADLFVSYGFVDLHIAYYRTTDGREFRVEVYRHDSAENAFGMYSQERAPEPYYVKISANKTGDAAARELEKIARALATRLAQPGDWPAALALLPTQGRVKNSEQYITESYLGYTFLHGAFQAQYTQGRSFEVFVIPAGSPGEAAHMASALCEVNHAPPMEGGVCTFKDVHHGDMDILISGRYLAGVVHCPDRETRSRYIEILQTSLR